MRLTSLIIGLLISNSIISQVDEWNKTIIKSNMIRNLTIYMKIPATNPDKDKEGLLKIRRIDFNKNGLVTNDTCFKCQWVEDNGTYDIIKEYRYNKQDLVYEKCISFDTIVYNYKKDSIHKNITLKFAKDFSKKNISTTSILNINNGLIQNQIDFDYRYKFTYRDSICQVFFETHDYDYSKKDTVILINKRHGIGVCLEKVKFESIMASSDNENLFILLRDLTEKHTTIIDTSIYIYNSKNNLKQIIESNNNSFTEFTYDENNLIRSKSIGLEYPIEFIYRFKK